MWYAIAYHVPDLRRRRRVIKILEGLGEQVSPGVFEAHATKEQIGSLLTELGSVINADRDKIRVYPICRRCRQACRVLGSPPALQEDFVWIV